MKLDTQLKAIFRNLHELYNESIALCAVFSLWLFYLGWVGALKPGAFQLSRLFPVLVIPGSYGLVLFSFVHVESRYVAPFLFLIFAGTLLWPEYDLRGRKTARHMLWATRFLVALIAMMLAHSTIDQSLRGLRSTDEKVSYDEAFSEFIAVKEYLETQGISADAGVSAVGWPPSYWARMARMRIVARVPDAAEFLEADYASRKEALMALDRAGIKAVVAKGQAFKALIQEGWRESAPHQGLFCSCAANLNLPGRTAIHEAHKFLQDSGISLISRRKIRAERLPHFCKHWLSALVRYYKDIAVVCLNAVLLLVLVNVFASIALRSMKAQERRTSGDTAIFAHKEYHPSLDTVYPGLGSSQISGLIKESQRAECVV